MKSVRSTSGMVRAVWSPYIAMAAKSFGLASCEFASNRFLVPSVLAKPWSARMAPWLWAEGLPM